SEHLIVSIKPPDYRYFKKCVVQQNGPIHVEAVLLFPGMLQFPPPNYQILLSQRLYRELPMKSVPVCKILLNKRVLFLYKGIPAATFCLISAHELFNFCMYLCIQCANKI